MHALTETMEIKVRCFVCKYLELRCACVRAYACMWLRESQFQVFVTNPNKSYSTADRSKRKRGNLELLFFMLGRPLFWAPAQSWKLTERSCHVKVSSQTHDILVTFQRQRACVMYFNRHRVLLSLQGHFNWSSRRWIKSSQVHLHTQSGYCWWQINDQSGCLSATKSSFSPKSVTRVSFIPRHTWALYEARSLGAECCLAFYSDSIKPTKEWKLLTLKGQQLRVIKLRWGLHVKSCNLIVFWPDLFKASEKTLISLEKFCINVTKLSRRCLHETIETLYINKI